MSKPEIKQTRRQVTPIPEKELYQLPRTVIEAFIQKERRHDELDRLQEVREQRKVWFRTIFFCGALNLLLIILAVMGMFT